MITDDEFKNLIVEFMDSKLDEIQSKFSGVDVTILVHKPDESGMVGVHSTSVSKDPEQRSRDFYNVIYEKF